MVVVLISGAIATGKTAVGAVMADRMPADLIKVREALGDVLGIEAHDRTTLQRRGADLDRRTGGRWLCDYIEEHRDPDRSIVVDSLRTKAQTLRILESIVDSRLVFLEAHEATRRERYALAAVHDPVKASLDFETAMNHRTEIEVQRLRMMAHLILETDDLDVSGVADTVLRELNLG